MAQPDPLQSATVFWSTDPCTLKADIARRPPTATKSQKLPFDEAGRWSASDNSRTTGCHGLELALPTHTGPPIAQTLRRGPVFGTIDQRASRERLASLVSNLTGCQTGCRSQVSLDVCGSRPQSGQVGCSSTTIPKTQRHQFVLAQLLTLRAPAREFGFCARLIVQCL